MWIVSLEYEVFKDEVADIFARGVEMQNRQLAGLARELGLYLFEVVLIYVQVSEGMDKFARFVSADLRHHHCKHCV